METNLWPVAFVLLVTWWVHSSLLLIVAFVISRCRRSLSPRTREWLWKSAVLLPCLTVPIQCGMKTAMLWRWELASVSEVQAISQVESASNPTLETFLEPSQTPALPNSPPMVIPELPEAIEPPAIAEKPGNAPIIIETIVADPLRVPAEIEPAPSLRIEEPLSAHSSSIASPIEIAKPLAVLPETPQDKILHTSARWPWYVPVFVSAVFVVGLLGGLRFLWVWCTTSRLIARSRILTSGLAHEELQRLLDQARIRGRMRLAESAECSVPAAGGLFRRVILLPLNIESRLSREELRALLAHELGHHARGDVWWLWLGRALCHLLPIQPLHFWAVREWHRAAEPLCDDWAIQHNISPIALAKSLTQVAGWKFAKPAIGPAATNGPSLLTHRVERLLNRETLTNSIWNRRLRLLTIPLLAMIALAFAPLVVWSQANVLPSDAALAVESAGIWDALNPSPVEPNLNEPTLAVEDPYPIPEDIRQELEAVQQDLELALTLLQETEEDPEVREAIRHLQQRLRAIRNRQAQLAKAAP